MKKIVLTMITAIALFGCEDVTKKMEQTQEAANKSIDAAQQQMVDIQEQVEDVDFNLGLYGDAAISAEGLAASVEEALDVDFSDAQAVKEVKEHIAVAYHCFVKDTSASTAEDLIKKIVATINSEQSKTLIEEGVESAKLVKECEM
ncbi:MULTISPECIES: hypothetical protein [Vibrio]|jgi:hypothetical protein|uniref:hypothetical protein n=1 Tax=Vibrio TaxID=662 RepID=UPI000C000B92|nr:MULTISPECIES: hypothetical protein [unclassified Vibrio]PHJ43055.1 hypothetical protein AK965_03085 [Vibrio sp. PID17_43]RIZ53546.1 hypothetical protein AK966_12650 [Vibrio sp. PID23_8]